VSGKEILGGTYRESSQGGRSLQEVIVGVEVVGLVQEEAYERDRCLRRGGQEGVRARICAVAEQSRH
jgi:hypothetical protein